MSLIAAPAVIMASISAYVGLYHFLNYAKRKSHREDLTFAVLCLATALYAIFCAGLYSTTSVADGTDWQRAQFMALSIFVVAFLWFVCDYTHQKPTIVTYAFSVFFAIAFFVQAVDRSTLTWIVDHPSIKDVTLPFGVSIRYLETEFGPFTTTQSLMGMAASFYIMWIGIRHLRRGYAREARPLLLATSVIFVAALNDTAVANGLYSFIYTIEYAYVAVILMMAFSLSKQVVEAAMTRDALRESEERFRSLVETTSDWVWEVDASGSYTYTSPKCRDLLGYGPEEMVGKTPFDLMPPEEARRVRAEFQRMVAQRRPIESLENINCHKDGRLVVLQTSAVPVFGESGNFLGYRGIDRDITEFKKSLEEKGRLQEQLQQAMKMEAVGRLAGGVAHDFNNLLTTIIGNVDLARTSLHSPEPVARYLNEIGAAADSAASLTRQLLAFSRRQLIQPKVINLNDLVRNLQKMLTRLLGEDVVLENVLDQKLGNVRVDPGQFEQVLVNLAVNARDAMPGGGTLSIQTSNADLDEEYCAHHVQVHPGRFVRLAVSDTGHGMSEEVKKHIFEPFFTTKPTGQGTGLGLATIFGIVKQTGGVIEVHSEEGQGTQFTIYVPRIEEATEKLAAKSSANELPTGQETILVVEDNEGVRGWVIKALQHLGYNVLSPPTETEVIEFARQYQSRIHLLMTDVVMPGINGRELASRLLALRPEIKVLFTSGYTQNVIAQHGVVEDNLNFIGKPYTLQALARKIREVLTEERDGKS